MSAKTYLRILQGGIIASLLMVFFVFSSLLFPYITSKQLSFNILMEVLLAIWLVFILRFPQYRPKKSYITWGLVAYFAAILVTSFTGVNFTLSFWGNAERMLGFFPIVHFLIFYLILITVFKTWKEWQALLISSVIIAVLVSLKGVGGANIYSSIGNTAYVSGYLIFNLFFSFLLWLRSEHQGWRWLYALGAIIMLWEFWTCHTSGAIIGLFSSILLLFLLLGLTHKNKNLRRSVIAILAVAIIGVVGIFSQYKSAWFQGSFLRNLTTQKATFQTRLISWKGAAADFKNHPWLGVGLGNYAVIFDKHFDASFFNYATSDTYFDRAHNNIIDITSTTGLVGLISYLSIFVAALYYLIKKFKKNGAYSGRGSFRERQNLEIIVIITLLAAYFIQNLAVFDSLVTYIGLMITLGFIIWLFKEYSPDDESEDRELISNNPADNIEEKKVITMSPDWEWLVLIILLLSTYIFTSQYNLKPWRVFKGTIVGYGNIVNGNFVSGFEAYISALSGTNLDHDARVTLINLVNSNPQILSSLSKDQAGIALDYVISLAEKNVAIAPLDSLSQMQLAEAYNSAARFYYEDVEKFNYYSDLSIKAIDLSIAASPGRAPVYLVKSQMLLMSKKNSEAIDAAKYAVSLNDKYYEGYCRLAQTYSFLQDSENIVAPLTSCIDLGGINSIPSNSLLASTLTYFASINDYSRALIVAERLASLNKGDAAILMNLAKLYLINGDNVKAQETAAEAIKIDKTLSSDWTDFEKIAVDLIANLAANSTASSTTNSTASPTTSPTASSTSPSK